MRRYRTLQATLFPLLLLQIIPLRAQTQTPEPVQKRAVIAETLFHFAREYAFLGEIKVAANPVVKVMEQRQFQSSNGDDVTVLNRGVERFDGVIEIGSADYLVQIPVQAWLIWEKSLEVVSRANNLSSKSNRALKREDKEFERAVFKQALPEGAEITRWERVVDKEKYGHGDYRGKGLIIVDFDATELPEKVSMSVQSSSRFFSYSAEQSDRNDERAIEKTLKSLRRAAAWLYPEQISKTPIADKPVAIVVNGQFVGEGNKITPDVTLSYLIYEESYEVILSLRFEVVPVAELSEFESSIVFSPYELPADPTEWLENENLFDLERYDVPYPSMIENPSAYPAN